MARKKETVTVEKGPKSARGGSTYVLRDSKTGRLIDKVTATPKSGRFITQSGSKHAKLFERLAKR
jgi:hypothetical protein